MLKFKYGRYIPSNAPGATPDLSWTTTILAPGAQGDKWTAELMDNKVEYIVPAAPTPTIVADGIAALLDALPGITSTNSGAVITTTRSVAPVDQFDIVSHLTIKVEGYGPDDGGPYPQMSGLDGVQYLNLNGASGGTYTLTAYSGFDHESGNPSGGQTTTAIAPGASVAQVQAALEALSNVAPGDVVVTLPESGLYAFAWGGVWGDPRISQVPLLSIDSSALTGQTSPPTLVYSAGSFTNVVASEAAISFDEFAVYESVPNA